MEKQRNVRERGGKGQNPQLFSVCVHHCMPVCTTVLTVWLLLRAKASCVANANVTFGIQIKLEQIPVGQSVPVGQHNLDVINMQMFTLVQSGAPVTCERGEKTQNKWKLSGLLSATQGEPC